MIQTRTRQHSGATDLAQVAVGTSHADLAEQYQAEAEQHAADAATSLTTIQGYATQIATKKNEAVGHTASA
jgi:hypothetical protein